MCARRTRAGRAGGSGRGERRRLSRPARRAVAASRPIAGVQRVARAVTGCHRGGRRRLRPLPERLLIELSVHRTLALRDALANDPDTAFLAALHALCLRTFTQRPGASCLELDLKSAGFGVQPPELAASAAARAIDARQRAWSAQLPGEPAALWETLVAFDGDSRAALFAHCVSFGVNACTSRGTGRRSAPPTPTCWPGRSASTWRRPAGRRRWTATSAGYRRRAS
ncbi:hypothetical protein [Azospirillum argentinense]|uniref:hypothetical protein n=1 Tax=Azospirillum argentinense TaxID=2970906 RepID=UPI0027E2648F|nr:hypothetical protein [Azospirillum argentinense]